ncbi:MAG: transcriptional regulator [Halobacteriovoraceae bacterium]|nr:transcriptional regulator [Halobacteriovoraceae bacterium]|tara:strand:+ start:38579 stop:38866 length:288 start_codon:yes stop_codon:yes gene_type:complete
MSELKHAVHKSQLTRINRIEGQVRGIKNMVEQEKYCVEILTQIKAVRSALKSLEMQILEGHAHHCLLSAMKSGNEDEASTKINELLELIKKSTKS